MSITESTPLENFFFAIKSPITRDRYKRRLEDFFKFLELEGNLESQAKSFTVQANKNGKSWVFANVMKDPEMANYMGSDLMSFDMKKMAYGGFKSNVEI